MIQQTKYVRAIYDPSLGNRDRGNTLDHERLGAYFQYSPTYIWKTCANAAKTCPHQNSLSLLNAKKDSCRGHAEKTIFGQGGVCKPRCQS